MKTRKNQCAKCRKTKIPKRELFIVDIEEDAKDFGIELNQKICLVCSMKCAIKQWGGTEWKKWDKERIEQESKENEDK